MAYRISEPFRRKKKKKKKKEEPAS